MTTRKWGFVRCWHGFLILLCLVDSRGQGIAKTEFVKSSWNVDLDGATLHDIEGAVVDSKNILWLLASVESRERRTFLKEIIRTDDAGRVISSSKLNLPSLAGEDFTWYGYGLSRLISGGVGLLVNKARYQPRGLMYLGGYYSPLSPEADVEHLTSLGEGGPVYEALHDTAKGLVVVGGTGAGIIVLQAALTGDLKWRAAIPNQVWLNSASLPSGRMCIVSWPSGDRFGRELRIALIDSTGRVLGQRDWPAHRGAVASGTDGGCAVLYNDAGVGALGLDTYHLTYFDTSLSRKWTVSVPSLGNAERPIQFVSVPNGYVATLGGPVTLYSSAGAVLSNAIAEGIRLVPRSDGFLSIGSAPNGGAGFRITRVQTK